MVEELLKKGSIETSDKEGNRVLIDIRNVKEKDNKMFVFFKVNGNNDIMDLRWFKETYPSIINI